MGDLHQFPGNDMTPPDPDPELPEEDWWADEMRDPPDHPDLDLPELTAQQVIEQDAEHWDQIPGVVRGFLAGIQRADRIAELTEPGSYVHRQSLCTVRRKIPVIREWLAQLEDLLGEDPEAEASLRDNLVVAGFEEEEVDRYSRMSKEEARRVLAEHDTGFNRLHLPPREAK